LYVAEAQLIFDIYTQLALHGWVLMLPGGGRNVGDGWSDKNSYETKWATYEAVDRSRDEHYTGILSKFAESDELKCIGIQKYNMGQKSSTGHSVVPLPTAATSSGYGAGVIQSNTDVMPQVLPDPTYRLNSRSTYKVLPTG
jgi:hypothetical protein